MKKIYLYFHAGSKNHGCEALVRTTAQHLSNKPYLISSSPDQDYQYGIDNLVNIQSEGKNNSNILEKILTKLSVVILKSEKYGYYLRSKYMIKNIENEGIALSIGGDNYCYGKEYNWMLAGLNKYFHKKNIKTVLWGCSIEKNYITEEVKKDFSKYNLITARETISYDILKKYNPNTILVADTAFLLDKEELPLPQCFIENETVGINISPLIQKKENIEGITLKNYQELIYYILNNTAYSVALIPHVVEKGNDDRVPLEILYNQFKDSRRICLIDDCNCKQLKGYISRCKMFIGARTHATIAAYSTRVPTLVIGYSTKAKGIAKDLFGTYENYVLPVQTLNSKHDMIDAFKWLDQHQIEIKKHLENVLPEYIKKSYLGFEAIKKL